MATKWEWTDKQIPLSDNTWFKKILDEVEKQNSITTIALFDDKYKQLASEIKTQFNSIKSKVEGPINQSVLEKFSMVIDKTQRVGKSLVIVCEAFDDLSADDKIKCIDKINVILDFHEYTTASLKRMIIGNNRNSIIAKLRKTQEELAMYTKVIPYEEDTRLVIWSFSDMVERFDKTIEELQKFMALWNPVKNTIINKNKKRDNQIKFLSYKKYILKRNEDLNKIIGDPYLEELPIISDSKKLLEKAEKLMKENKKYLLTKSQVGRKNIELKNSKNVEAAPKTKIDFSTESDINKILNAIENI